MHVSVYISLLALVSIFFCSSVVVDTRWLCVRFDAGLFSFSWGSGVAMTRRTAMEHRRGSQAAVSLAEGYPGFQCSQHPIAETDVEVQ